MKQYIIDEFTLGDVLMKLNKLHKTSLSKKKVIDKTVKSIVKDLTMYITVK